MWIEYPQTPPLGLWGVPHQYKGGAFLGADHPTTGPRLHACSQMNSRLVAKATLSIEPLPVVLLHSHQAFDRLSHHSIVFA